MLLPTFYLHVNTSLFPDLESSSASKQHTYRRFDTSFRRVEYVWARSKLDGKKRILLESKKSLLWATPFGPGVKPAAVRLYS